MSGKKSSGQKVVLTKQQVIHALMTYAIIISLGALMALTYVVFVFANNFAPSGISGIATMIQYKTGFDVSWFTLIFNIPLAIIAFFVVNKQYAIRSFVFVVTFSSFLILFQNIPNMYVYVAQSDGARILAGMASGAVVGFVYGVVLKANSSTGGVDFIAAFIQKTRPYISVTWFIFILNVAVAISSFFVYGDMEAILLCILHCYIVQTLSDQIVVGSKQALKFEVVTTHPEEISNEIIEKLHHSATLVTGEGMYSHAPKQVLTCVINKRQIVEFETIIRKYPETFAYVVPVNETIGFFYRKDR